MEEEPSKDSVLNRHLSLLTEKNYIKNKRLGSSSSIFYIIYFENKYFKEKNGSGVTSISPFAPDPITQPIMTGNSAIEYY